MLCKRVTLLRVERSGHASASRKALCVLRHMKKISYASDLEGKQVLPIQAMTALLYIVVGLVATLLFLNGSFTIAFVLAMIITQLWRIFSKTLRADIAARVK